MKIRVVVLAGIIALVLLFFVLDLGRFLTLEALQAQLATLRRWQSQSPLLFAMGFVGIYTSVAALCLPGGVLLTIASGALFGLLWGTVFVSVASSVGAMVAFLSSRFLLRDVVQARFGGRLAVINDGLARDGAFYLFSLRLVPIIPFFIVNLLVGLTPIRPKTFLWVSLFGMLPVTIVVVNAGVQLAQLDSLSGIMSPAMLGPFVLLGMIPLVVRRIAEYRRRRQVISNGE